MLDRVLPELHNNIIKFLNPKDLKNIRCVSKKLSTFGYNMFVKKEFEYICKHGGDIQRLNQLLQYRRIKPSANNNRAIRWASENGHIEVVNRLLEDSRVVDLHADDKYVICMFFF